MKKIVLLAMDFLTTAAPSTIVTTSTTSFGGRPKGTTAALRTDMAKLTKQCIVISAEESISVREEERKKYKRAGKNTLNCIIERWNEALGIPLAVDIKRETFRSRAKRFNPRGLKEAVTSPMLKVEPYWDEVEALVEKFWNMISFSQE